MSTTTTVYDREEDEDGSDSASIDRGSNVGFGTSSPPLQNLTLTSTRKPIEYPRTESLQSRSRRFWPRESAWRKYKNLPIDKYRGLFHDTVVELEDFLSNEFESDLRPSKIGIVTWSGQEKNRFFNALARKSRLGLSAVAAMVGTKSEVEVKAYLDVLQRSLQKHIPERSTKNITLGDIPAAVEISNGLNEVLDDTAQALVLEEERIHDTNGKRKHGHVWLVDTRVAEMITDEIESEEADTGEGSPELFATARLLNVTNWIRLSEHIFMNFGGERVEDNWRNLAFEGETPSLTCDAFADFYALTVSITRRLVQSSLFFAMSRLRAPKRASRATREKTVKEEDVIAALEVLKMSRDSEAFWVGVARRLSLDVKDESHTKGRPTRNPTHDEAEYFLLRGSYPVTDTLAGITLSTTDHEDNLASGSEISDPRDSDDSSSHSQDVTHDELSDELSDPEEVDATSVDYKASEKEEQSLWEALDESFSRLPSPMSGQVKTTATKERYKPHSSKKTTQDAVDWRKRILPRSEWEEYGQGTVILRKELAENRRKRIRTR